MRAPSHPWCTALGVCVLLTACGCNSFPNTAASGGTPRDATGKLAAGSGGSTKPMAQVSRKDTKPLPASGVNTLKISSGDGSLEIIGVDNQQTIEVVAEVCVEASNLDEAIRLRDEVQVRFLTGDPARPLLEISEPQAKAPGNRIWVDVRILAPRGVRMVVTDRAGKITVTGLKAGLEIARADGVVAVREIEGGASIFNAGGPTDVSMVTGAVEIQDGPNSLSISNITGNLQARGGGGVLMISNIEGNVTAGDNPEGVSAKGIDGNLTLFDIVYTDAKIENVSGKIEFAKSEAGQGAPAKTGK